MNKLERVVATLNCEETDRPPIYDLIRNDAGIEHFSGMRMDINNPAPAVFKAYAAFADATKSGIRLPDVEGKTVVINGEEYVTHRWTHWKLRESHYDGDALKLRVDEKIRQNREAVKSVDEAVARYVEDCIYKQSQVGETVIFPNCCGGSCGIYSAYLFCGGLEQYSYFLCDYPDDAEELIESYVQLTLASVNALPADFAPPAMVIAEDIGGKGGPLFSPAYLRSSFFPRLGQVVNALHGRGVKAIMHSDGDLNCVMDDIVKSGIDGLHPIETIAGMDIENLRQRYPNLVFLGGIDCSQLLPFGKPEEVYAVVKDSIAKTKYGYFPGSSSEINDEVPLENIIALYEAVHDRN